MERYFEDYLQRLTELFDDLRATIDSVAQDGLDWIPGEDMNSLCVLVVHTVGAARFWIGDVPLGDNSDRDRPSEFAAFGVSEAMLKQKIDGILVYAAEELGKMRVDDLNRMCLVPSSDRTKPKPERTREFSAGWSLLHALEHTALHVGHAQITRQLWDQRKTD